MWGAIQLGGGLGGYSWEDEATLFNGSLGNFGQVPSLLWHSFRI